MVMYTVHGTEIYFYLLDVLLIFNAYVQKYVCTGCPNLFNAYVHCTEIFMYWMS